VLCGGVVVGEDALVGAGAVVLPNIRIGANTVVGAGSVVTSNVPDGATVRGVPAHA
jgi:acetyltransferase-like isoleucine patch superfamily enzyme